MKNQVINGVEFEVDVDFDNDGQIEMLAVFLPGSDVELSDVLDAKVLKQLNEAAYEQYEGPEMNEDDPREDR